MKIVDTHCHPQFPQYDSDREEIIKRAFNNDIGIICVGTDLERSKQAIELASKHESIWASVGLHPNDNLGEAFDPEEYYLLAQNKKVVAIGEVGLDYYRTKKLENQHFQKKRFIKQIQLASELNLPLIIHCRDAHQDMINLLTASRSSLSDNPGVIHSFTGTWENAKKYIDLGFYIGFNGIITFARQYDEIVINTPFDKTLLETDAPYLTPELYRGKKNEPVYIKYVAEKIAELRKISVEEIAEQTTQNAKTLFKLNV